MIVTFIVADIRFDDGNITNVEFKTDKIGFALLQPLIDELVHSQNEFIILVDGVPYRWDLWDGGIC